MSEKIYACLLRLYPAKFRHAYGKDALQLFRDRRRDETGFFRRTCLWLELFLDLAISLPRQYINLQPALGAPSVAHFAGTPLFFVLEEKSLRPGALFIRLRTHPRSARPRLCFAQSGRHAPQPHFALNRLRVPLCQLANSRSNQSGRELLRAPSLY